MNTLQRIGLSMILGFIFYLYLSHLVTKYINKKTQSDNSIGLCGVGLFLAIAIVLLIP